MKRDLRTDLHSAVADYIDRGWKPIVIKERSKRPVSKAWQNSSPAPDNFGATNNVGIILGPPSDNLVDIDLDCPEACRVAALSELLGGLPAFGREGTVPGHRLVRCPDLPADAATCTKLAYGTDTGSRCVLELRAGSGFTVFPPSVHEAPVVWADGEPPVEIPEIEWDQLQTLVRLTGLLSVALIHYPGEGSRDDYVMHLGGALMHLGVPGESGDELLRALAELAGDEEADVRALKCSQAWNRKEEQNITGLTRLIEDHLGEEIGKRLRKWLGTPVKNEIKIPEGAIKLDTPSISRLFNQLQDGFLSKAPELVFQRAGKLVHVRKLDEVEFEREGGVVFQEETVEIAQAKAKWLELKADELGLVFKKGERPQRLCPPGKMDILIAAAEETRFPRLRGISTTPTLYRNEPGYDPQSRLLLRFPEGQFPSVAMQPPKEAAAEALERLKWPLREFPFRHEASRSVVLSAVLSGIIRGELRTCPLHGFSAPIAGTGKTKLAEYVAAIVIGAMPNMISHSASDEEMEKRLFAILLRGCPLVSIDNVSEPLSGDALCAILTAPTYTGRILGASETATVDTRTLMLTTGNNLAVSGDLSRRTLLCRLDAESESPDRRHFEFDPVQDAKGDRYELVSDALTVLRSFDAAGRPLPAQHRPLGSFEEWDSLVRGALIWLGEADPVETQERDSDNEEREMQSEILQALRNDYGEAWVTVSKLHDVRYTDDGQFPIDNRAAATIASYLRNGYWDRRGAGRLLKQLVDKPVGGLVLRARHSTETNANEYKVMEVGSRSCRDRGFCGIIQN